MSDKKRHSRNIKLDDAQMAMIADLQGVQGGTFTSVLMAAVFDHWLRLVSDKKE